MTNPPEDNVAYLPRKKPKGSGTFEVVSPYGGCPHRHFDVDERLLEVTCRDCKAKLSPMWVLVQLAYEDTRLRNQWVHLRAEVRLLGDKTKTKCVHCEKFTPVRSKATNYELHQVMEQIKREDEL